MGELAWRLNRLEQTVIAQQVDRQMAAAAPVLAQWRIPQDYAPLIRRGLEESARWAAAHAPATPEMIEARIQDAARRYADELGVTPEEVIAEAERIAALLPEDWT